MTVVFVPGLNSIGSISLVPALICAKLKRAARNKATIAKLAMLNRLTDLPSTG
jgi:hypothetical protein